MYKFIISLTVIIIYCAGEILGALVDRIDIASDVRFPWRMKGDYIYVSSGHELQNLKQHFPGNFSLDSLQGSRGIWILFPSEKPTDWNNNNAIWTSKLTIEFKAMAQLLDTLKITYNAAGSPIINIIFGGKDHIITPEIPMPGWSSQELKLIGSTFKIEISTNGEHDFVLIDQVAATFVETTTSPRPPRPITTTKRPKPINATCTLSFNWSMLIAFIIIQYLCSCILY